MSSNLVRRPGGWYYGWNIVAVCMLSQIAANGVTYNSLTLFLRPWSEELHAPISEILLAFMPMLICMSLLAPFAGTLADRKPARLLLGIGLVGLALMHLSMSAASKIWHIQALYALTMPITVNLAGAVTCNPVVARWFVRRAGLAQGLNAFGIGIAGIILPPIIAEVMPEIGWRNVWLIAGIVIGLVILPIVLFVVRDKPTEREGLHYVTADAGSAVSHHSHGAGDLRWSEVIRRKNFLLIAAVFIAVMSVYIGCLQNLAPLALSRGIDQKTTGMLLSVFSGVHVAATLVMGIASDRLGNRLPLVFLAITGMSGAILLGYGSSLGALTCGAALVGSGGGIWPVLAASMSVEFGAANMGRAFGMLSTTLIIPSAMPSLIARIQEATGAYGPPLLGLALLCVIAGLLVLQMRERRGGQPASGVTVQPHAGNLAG